MCSLMGVSEGMESVFREGVSCTSVRVCVPVSLHDCALEWVSVYRNLCTCPFVCVWSLEVLCMDV